MKKKVLFISYNGMTDPLGQSQVLPYLCHLSREGYNITILSVEKKEKLEKEGETVQEIVSKNGLKWEKLIFHNSLPVISKAYDRYLLFRAANQLQQKEKFDFIHCRSHIAAEIGMVFKKKYHIPFIFDMRAFWPDEKKESGHWPQKNPIYRRVYKYYKKLEKKLLLDADAVVVLTHAAKKEISSWDIGPRISEKITVIPCCADLQLFSINNIDFVLKAQLIDKFNLKNRAPVICYLGSIGDVYGVNEMLLFFNELKRFSKDAKFLFFSKEPATLVTDRLSQFDNIQPSDIAVTFVPRKDLPTYLSLCDFSLFFYKPTYSRIACSPTKFAELISLGLPIVCNEVGDLNSNYLAGMPIIVIRDLQPELIKAAVGTVTLLQKPGKEMALNSFAKKEFDLVVGVERYKKIYSTLHV